MTVPEGLDTGFDGPLFQRCLEEGVLYVPGEYAFAPEPGPVPRNHLRLTFGVPAEGELVEGARRLAVGAACMSEPSPAEAPGLDRGGVEAGLRGSVVSGG